MNFIIIFNLAHHNSDQVDQIQPGRGAYKSFASAWEFEDALSKGLETARKQETARRTGVYERGLGWVVDGDEK